MLQSAKMQEILQFQKQGKIRKEGRGLKALLGADGALSYFEKAVVLVLKARVCMLTEGWAWPSAGLKALCRWDPDGTHLCRWVKWFRVALQLQTRTLFKRFKINTKHHRPKHRGSLRSQSLSAWRRGAHRSRGDGGRCWP